ncbi:MAG TPA: hypothetical protein VI456_03805 [Polyangia bacterium]
MTRIGRAVLAAIVLQGGACATVTYPGPRLPSDQVAIVEAKNVAIDEIDGLDVRGKGATFEVRAGTHALVVHLAMVTRYPGFRGANGQFISLSKINTSRPMPFCVTARPKHHYMIEPKDAGALWEPIVFDGSPDAPVPPCGPVASYHRDDFPCAGALAEEILASGVQKVTGCGIQNVYGYDLEAGQWRSVTEQAMFDLNCPGQKLTVHHLGGAAVSISGCGVRTDYVASTPCVDGLCSFKSWVRSGVPLR